MKTSPNSGLPTQSAVEGGRGLSTASATQRLVIEDFPAPHIARALSPNGRPHWAAKRRARDVVRFCVFTAIRNSGMKAQPPVVTMQPTFVYPVKRARDDDNLATGVLKAVRDALVVERVLVADDIDHLRQLPVEVRIEKGRRALILEFTSKAQP